MKLIIVFVLFIHFSNAQSSEFEVINGNGIINVEFTNSVKSINFYSKPNLNTKIGALQLVEPWENKEYWKWIQPDIFKPDYHLVEFRYKSETNDFYQIFTNVEGNSTLWIKKSNIFKHSKWKDYFLNVLSIEPINKKKHNIYSRPNFNSKITRIDCDSFKVLVVKDNWLKIERSFVCDDNKIKKKKGWIQWRNEREILIKWYNLS